MNQFSTIVGRATIVTGVFIAVLFFALAADTKTASNHFDRRQAAKSSAKEIETIIRLQCAETGEPIPQFDSRHLPTWWDRRTSLDGLDASLYVITMARAVGQSPSNEPFLTFRGSAASSVLGR